MKLNTLNPYILPVVLGITIVFTGCRSDDDESNNPLNQDKNTWVDNNTHEQNKRISIINEPIILNQESGKKESGSGKKAKGNGTISSTPQTNCNSGCTSTISNAQSGNLNINGNQHICISAGASFQGSINMNGGVLSVCGSVQLNNINLNNGAKVIINEGASFAVSSPLNVNGGTYFVNYSKDGVHISGGANNNNVFENYGIIDISGNFNNNGNSELINTCRMNIAGDFHQNGDFDHFGYLSVNGTVFFNTPTGSNDLNSTSLISCNNIFINTTLNGLGSDYSKIDISSTTTINGSGEVLGKIDICDAGGINTNNGTLASSVTFCDAYIQPSGDCKPASGDAPDTEFILVADVDAPKMPETGSKLSATSIQIIGNYAYVSWHLNAGPEDYAGLLEVYDVNNPENPQIITSLWSKEIDFNHVYVDPNGTASQRKFWAVGSRDQNLGSLDTPGFLGEWDLTNEIFTNETFKQTDLPSFSGNCVVEKNGELLLVSGNTGGALSKLNLSSEALDIEKQQDGLKYLDFDGNKLIMLSQGNPNSELHVYNLPSPDYTSPIHSISVGPITPEDGKNVAHLNGNHAFVATGDYGLKIFDVVTGSSTPIHEYNTNLPGATNGTSTDNDYIYIANGSSGLHILNRSDFSLLGNYSYNGSANFVASKNNYVFVANGIGGLKIIRRDN